MELLHLKYFLTVAKHQHITKAANELRIAQPSLSKIITSLEKELDINLFDRKGRSIILNDNGKYFYDNVSKSLSILDDSISILREKTLPSQREIVLYVLSASSLMSELIVSFRERYPDIDINIKLIQALSEDSSLNKDDYDLCIFSSGGSQFGKKVITLLDEEILLAVPSSNPLSLKKSISLKDVKNQNFIALGNGNFKQLTQSFFEEYNFTPNIVFESNNTYAVRSLISSGQGISLVPKYSWKFDSYRNIKLYELDKEKYHRSIHLYQSPYSKNKEYVSILKDFMIEFFDDLKK